MPPVLVCMVLHTEMFACFPSCSEATIRSSCGSLTHADVRFSCTFSAHSGLHDLSQSKPTSGSQRRAALLRCGNRVDSHCCWSLCPQAQAASARRHQVQPVQAPPGPPQRRAGQAHQPAAVPGGGAGAARQAVGASAQRRLPKGQELL